MPSAPQAPVTASQELQRALRLRDGIRRLGQLEAINSLGDTLEWEVSAVKFQTAIDQAAITNTEFPKNEMAAETESDMKKTLIAGDVNNFYSQPTETTTTPTTPAAPTPEATGALTKLAGPALLGAALLASGGGGVALYNYLTNQPTTEPVITEPTAPTPTVPSYKLGAEVTEPKP